MEERWMHSRKPQSPERPPVDLDWQAKHPEGSLVRIAEYDTEHGWHWRHYWVVKYYPHIVHCQDKNGFNRCFGNWEFQVRQVRKVDALKGSGRRWWKDG